jgi:hypothetical protein
MAVLCSHLYAVLLLLAVHVQSACATLRVRLIRRPRNAENTRTPFLMTMSCTIRKFVTQKPLWLRITLETLWCCINTLAP